MIGYLDILAGVLVLYLVLLIRTRCYLCRQEEKKKEENPKDCIQREKAIECKEDENSETKLISLQSPIFYAQPDYCIPSDEQSEVWGGRRLEMGKIRYFGMNRPIQSSQTKDSILFFYILVFLFYLGEPGGPPRWAW